MATTILPRDLDTGPAGTSQNPRRARTTAAWFGWVLAAALLVLAMVLAVLALGSDGDAASVPSLSVEHRSITAIDHAVEQQTRNRSFPVETGSITAIDHAVEQQARKGDK